MNAQRQCKSWISKGRRLPGVSLLLAGLAALGMAVPGWSEAFQLAQAPSLLSTPLNWLTCHLTHWSWNHFLWDTAVFLFFGWFLEEGNRKKFIAAILLSSLAISFSFRAFLPELSAYRGLSGVDSALFGLFFVLAEKDALKDKDAFIVFVIAMAMLGFGLKSIYEIISGQTVFVEASSTMVGVPLAHVVGLSTGVLVGFFDGQLFRKLHIKLART